MERGREVQLIINPGSTSMKLALFQGEEKMIQEDVVWFQDFRTGAM